MTAQGTWLCMYPVLSVFKKVFGAFFFQTQTKLAVVVTEKPLLGSVSKVLPLPLPLLTIYIVWKMTVLIPWCLTIQLYNFLNSYSRRNAFINIWWFQVIKQISSIDPFRDNCTTIFKILNFIVLQLLSNRNKLNLFTFHLLFSIIFWCASYAFNVCCVTSLAV